MNENETRPAPLLLLGDPRLRRPSAPVEDPGGDAFRAGCRRLHATLAEFRARHGFGRAVSAPQIGLAQRFIAINLGGTPFTIINPEITARSNATFTLWDDCMSFPDLLVRVRRHRSISLRYVDEQGVPCTMDELDEATSELLQHEIDHLDGVLAVDRALDRDAIIYRRVFDADRPRFAALVDYVIGA
ncbi:MAG: peptide deformylase [Gammaproteobacteria bacterium]|nr:peptide deformylase [Gammaproteobacteria bacterium]